MSGEAIIAAFLAHLDRGATYRVEDPGDGRVALVSPTCRILFNLQGFAPGRYSLAIARPDGGCEMSVLLLRHLLGARYARPGDQGPEADAELFNRCFGRILAGDFAIFEPYELMKGVFFPAFKAVMALPDQDPIKQKALNYDISWLAEFKRGRPE